MPPPSIGRSTLAVLPIALASRGLAFAVPLAVAMWFGVGVVTDAWYWALAFPTFAMVLAASSLGTAATPVVAAVRRADGDARAAVEAFVGSLASWTALGSLAAAALVAAAGPAALDRLTDFPVETRVLAARYLWELVPFVALNASGTVLRVTAEVFGHFRGVAATPAIRASAVILATGALLGPLGADALAWGLVVGEAVQFAWWARLLAASGLRPRPNLHRPAGVRRVGADLLPILAGEVLVALNLVVDKGFAAWLPTGAVATLEFADRARVIPQTLLDSTLLMVAFATWSNLHAGQRTAEARAAVGRALRWVIALGAPPVAGLFIGRVALVRLLYERGAFLAADTEATARVLAGYAPGILPGLLGTLAVRAHVVERRLRPVVVLGVVSVLLNAGLDALLLRPMGTAGLALSTSLVTGAVAGAWLVLTLPRLPRGPWGAPLAVLAGSVGVAALVELLGGPPERVTDPRLWLAALPCFALLGLGWRAARAEGEEAP